MANQSYFEWMASVKALHAKLTQIGQIFDDCFPVDSSDLPKWVSSGNGVSVEDYDEFVGALSDLIYSKIGQFYAVPVEIRIEEGTCEFVTLKKHVYDSLFKKMPQNQITLSELIQLYLDISDCVLKFQKTHDVEQLRVFRDKLVNVSL